MADLAVLADLETAAETSPDRRTRRFAEMALERGETGAWTVLHCANPSCRCECRKYVRSLARLTHATPPVPAHKRNTMTPTSDNRA